jgi:DNA-directed RNA polymerase specialized sigma24 family protein
MSAALQQPSIWALSAEQAVCFVATTSEEQESAAEMDEQSAVEKQPALTLAFYRKHTESLLRRYLYASMLVGRSPSMLDHPVARGWATSRPVRTFEDAVNFVLDIEMCLAKLSSLDRSLLSRIVLQEYTVAEASVLLRINIHTTASKLSQAVDRLTEILMKADLLVLPHKSR